MHKAFVVVPVLLLLVVIAVLFQVSINYVELRREQLWGESRKRFNDKVERNALSVMALVILSVLSLAWALH